MMTFIKDPQDLTGLWHGNFSVGLPLYHCSLLTYINDDEIASLEIITPVLMGIQVFWDLKPCRLVNR